MNRVRRYLPSASRSCGAKKGKGRSRSSVCAARGGWMGTEMSPFWFVWLVLDTLAGFLEGSTYVEIG